MCKIAVPSILVHLTGSLVVALAHPLVHPWGDNFVLHLKVIPKISLWAKLHKDDIRYVLEIYFPSFSQVNQNYQQLYVIMEFAINYTFKLPRNQKCCNFVKNWYKGQNFTRQNTLGITSHPKWIYGSCQNRIARVFPIFHDKWYFWVIFTKTLDRDIYWMYKIPFYGNPSKYS